MSQNLFNKIPIIDLSNINPNKILEFSYNYELLKYVLTALINNQQNLNGDINKLKLAHFQQQKYCGELESQIIEIKIENESSPEELDKLYKQKNAIESKNKQFNNELEEFIKQNNEQIPSKEIKVYTMKEAKHIVKKEIQEQDFNFGMLNQENETEKTVDKDNKEIKDTKDTKEIKTDIKTEEKEKEKKEKKEEIPKDDLVNKKMLEDINKKIELLYPDITSLKSSIQSLQKDFSNLKTTTTEQSKQNIEKNIPKLVEDLLNNKITTIKKSINNDINQVREKLNVLDYNTEEKLTKLTKDTKNLESINEQFEKNLGQIKVVYDKLKNNLSSNAEKLTNTVTPLAFANSRKELEQKIEAEKKLLSIEILDLQNVVSSLKTQVIDHLNDFRDRDNIAHIMKLIETMSGNIRILLDYKKITEEKEKRKAIIDSNKFVKPETFNEGINNLKKLIDNFKKDFSELRIDMASIRENDLNMKASLKDLKGLEDSIFEKMEKLKDIIKNNFVEKNMLVKNLKYIEFQTKHLIEENKKVDKQENWLLAKKPFNGHLCASCEAYIGELKQATNSNFVNWNRIPIKGVGDLEKRIFRINAGFSKVVQMVNQDNKNDKNDRAKSNSSHMSKEDRYCSSTGRKERRKILNLNKGKKDRKIVPSRSYAAIEEFDLGKSLPKILLKNKMGSGGYTTQNKNYTSLKNSTSNIDIRGRDEFYENLKDMEESQQNIDSNPKIKKIFKKKGYSPEKTD